MIFSFSRRWRCIHNIIVCELFFNILKFDFACVNPRSTISDVSIYDYRVYLFMIRATQDALKYNVGMQMYKKKIHHLFGIEF